MTDTHLGLRRVILRKVLVVVGIINRLRRAALRERLGARLAVLQYGSVYPIVRGLYGTHHVVIRAGVVGEVRGLVNESASLGVGAGERG